jgi:hypothetical protein
MESLGVVQDMWNAMLYLKEKRPNLIQSVEWFTLEKGFSESSPPMLIALQPFGEEEEISTEVRNWIYYDSLHKRPRGIMVVRITTPEKIVHIIEIQRRPTKKKDAKGVPMDAEQAFMGLVFELKRQSEFEEWIKKLALSIRGVRGVMVKVVDACPGRALAFKHSRTDDEAVPCMAAVLNALGKVGVKEKKA